MGSLSTWLISMVGPLVARFLVSMGLSLVTAVGFSTAADALQSQIIASIHGMPQKALQLGGLLGIWRAVGIWLGAIAFIVAWRSVTSSWSLAKLAIK